MGLRFAALPLLLALFTASVACGDGDSGDRRRIQILQRDESCTPTAIQLAVGEKVSFEVKNEARKAQELEGIEGTKLEEVLIPEGKTRTVSYTAPTEPGIAKLKCYEPGGQSTTIELTTS